MVFLTVHRDSTAFEYYKIFRRRLHQTMEKRFLDRSRWFSYREDAEFPGRLRSSRQLIVSGPAYGFSGYFKPVILEASDGLFSI